MFKAALILACLSLAGPLGAANVYKERTVRFNNYSPGAFQVYSAPWAVWPGDTSLPKPQLDAFNFKVTSNTDGLRGTVYTNGNPFPLGAGNPSLNLSAGLGPEMFGAKTLAGTATLQYQGSDKTGDYILSFKLDGGNGKYVYVVLRDDGSSFTDPPDRKWVQVTSDKNNVTIDLNPD